MTTTLPAQSDTDPVLPAPEEADDLRRLATLLAADGFADACLVAPSGQPYRLPPSVHQLLKRVVQELASGNAAEVTPVPLELTTLEAANMLFVPFEYMVKLLDMGGIPSHGEGYARRVPLPDLLVYRERRDRERRAALAEMANDAQLMGLYD
ncbi:MAG: hypothetical protein NTZ05_21940 [Chloroflexi bacterium]|nr:hypothetical protein [Chloroflexota bacterium]